MMRHPESDTEYMGIPEPLRSGVRGWIEHGRRPGGFLMAVIENDLLNACARADDQHAPNLKAIVLWFFNQAPGPCWGSAENARRWEAQFTAPVEGAQP